MKLFLKTSADANVPEAPQLSPQTVSHEPTRFVRAEMDAGKPSGRTLVVLAVLNLVLIGGGSYWLVATQMKLREPRFYVSASPNLAPSNDVAPASAPIKTIEKYYSPTIGLSFTYPATWDVQDVTDNSQDLAVASTDLTFTTDAGQTDGNKEAALRSGTLLVTMGSVSWAGGSVVVKDSQPVTFLGRPSYATWLGRDRDHFNSILLTPIAYRAGAKAPESAHSTSPQLWIGFLTKNTPHFSSGYDDVLLTDTERPEVQQALQLIPTVKQGPAS